MPEPPVPLPAMPFPAPAAPDSSAPSTSTTNPSASPAPEAVPFRAWHFAEGNSRNGFETLLHPAEPRRSAGRVTAHYNRDDGIRLMQWIGIEPHARLSLNANDVVGRGRSAPASSPTRTSSSSAPRPGGRARTARRPSGSRPMGSGAWYFAEGTTRGRATTYFVTQNLTDAQPPSSAPFTRDDGSPRSANSTLPPRGRDAYRVNDLLQDTAFSASFRADQDIVVERTIMTEGERPPTVKRSREDKGPNVQTNGRTDESFAMARNAVGIFGGLGYVGSATDPASSLEFAEGSTRGPYATTFVLFNPGQRDTDVRFTFRPGAGRRTDQDGHRPGVRAALAFDPRDVVPAADFATSITSDSSDRRRARLRVQRRRPVRRARVHGPRRTDSRAWYFAEGNTTNQIEMFFIFQPQRPAGPGPRHLLRRCGARPRADADAPGRGASPCGRTTRCRPPSRPASSPTRTSSSSARSTCRVGRLHDGGRGRRPPRLTRQLESPGPPPDTPRAARYRRPPHTRHPRRVPHPRNAPQTDSAVPGITTATIRSSVVNTSGGS